MNLIRNQITELFCNHDKMRKASIFFFVVTYSANSQIIIAGTEGSLESTEIRPTTATGPLRRDLDRVQSAGLADPPALRWRATELRPRVSYEYLHGDGILANPADLRTTDINTYTVGLSLKQGKHWSADYASSRSFYSNSGFYDTSAHSARVTAFTTHRSWDFKASQSYQSESLPSVDTAQQTAQQSHATALITSTSFNSRFFLESIFNQELHFPDQYSTTREWHGQEWLHYKFADRLELSAGIHAGYVSIGTADDMQFNRPQLKMRSQNFSAVSIEASAGIEHRKLLNQNSRPLRNAIYALSANYTFSETTFLSLSGARDITVSYFSPQAIINSTVTADLRQRILGHFYFIAAIGTQHAQYVPFRENLVNLRNREDKRKYFELKLLTVIRGRLSLLVFLKRINNNTNREGYGFESNQSGLEISYIYAGASIQTRR